MSTPNFIPALPESAPFTPEQRAYLNGFLAGLFSRVPATAAPASAGLSKPATPLTIVFGSQTGTAESLAKRIAKEAGKRGLVPTIHDLASYPVAQLAAERALLVVTSTYGDGEPPDNARGFGEFLASDRAPRLEQTRFAVCALGDTNYPKFCEFGRQVDAALEQLGAQRVHARVDCDVDYEAAFQAWLAGALSAFEDGGKAAGSPGIIEASSAAGTAAAVPSVDSPATGFSRSNPFPAPMIANVRLNGDGSAKDTRHLAFSLAGSGLDYAAGDALGVFPRNCAELVGELIAALGARGDEPVPGMNGGDVSLREALTAHYEITKLNLPLLKVFAERTGDDLLARLTAPDANGELTRFLWGREVIDLLLAHPGVRLSPAEFVGLLKKLPPRLYSIASSPRAHAGEVHLCVGVVRYEALGRPRKGVCSTFLAERVAAEAPVPVFLHRNPNFRPPADGARPMIMVGPGTGIAPFRGFLHERRATGAAGKNWLFFGDQRATTDFLYRAELEELHRTGALHRLDTAFSRDQAEKVYVQQRMLEHAAELFAWLEAGAHFYVCGDAARMAKDVDAALHQIIERAGGKTAEQAAEYVATLKAAKRYQRDVY
jgi:sulfite reductase (NADPH) flavoprotein alpha-component